MDRIDKKILTLLQENGKLTNQELADKVALSPSPCLRRVNQLQEEGVIEKYVALLKPELVGLQLHVITSVGMDKHSPDRMKQFENTVRKIPEIMECFLITGQAADYILKIVVSDMNHYQKILLDKITQIPGVTSVHSSFILRKIVDKTDLTLDYI